MTNIYVLQLLIEAEAGIACFLIFFIIIHYASEKLFDSIKTKEASKPVTKATKIKKPYRFPIEKFPFLLKLKNDLDLIYKRDKVETFVSQDGNTLYLDTKNTLNWTRQQIVLFLLAKNQGFLDQLKAKDINVFTAIENLQDNVDIQKIEVAFKGMRILPSFTKDITVWQLSLLPTNPTFSAKKDVIVKELNPKQ